jgi:diacylglycerol kinase family enzyme
LLGLQIEPENMVVDFVGILVEAAKSVDLIIAHIGDGSIHETGRALAHSGHDGRHVGVVCSATRRVGTA